MKTSRLRIVNGTFSLALYVAMTWVLGTINGLGASLYVSPGGGHVPPFSDWAMAATNIQSAIDASSDGDTVWVTNGVYNSGGVKVSGNLTNRIAVTKAIAVRSINGPQATVIEGYQTPYATNGSVSIRCAWVGAGATLDGFTLTKGSTGSSGSNQDNMGGGCYCSTEGAVITNCVISGNSASSSGGGVWGGTIQGCTIENSRAAGGGGIFGGRAWNCVIQNNSANVGGGADETVLLDSQITGNTAHFGGGSYSASANIISNCVIVGNQAYDGGGAYKGALVSCLVRSNSAERGGGGTKDSTHINCAILRNRAATGGGAFMETPSSGWLHNCTVVQNRGSSGGGMFRGSAVNSIVYFNFGTSGVQNHSGTAMTNCCTYPSVFLGKNMVLEDPQLLGDGIHLSTTSPCIGRGTNLWVAGLDIDGQEWSSVPSIGCDEWHPGPVLIRSPRVLAGSVPGEALVSVEVAGAAPYCWWIKDGELLEDNGHLADSHSPSLVVANFGPADAGDYQVVVSNSFGAVTSEVSRVSVLCVDASNENEPTVPYASWSTAARTIQAAIESADDGSVVLVTNGLYGAGGKALPGETFNRVLVDKPLTVMSVNGAEQTTIEGAWDPVSTNGAGSVRCAWVGQGGLLSGFTLRNGSTAGHGGGVGSADLEISETVALCVITNCRAAGKGGGAYQGRLRQCVLTGNGAGSGGGASDASLVKCILTDNFAGSGGGVYQGMLDSCEVLRNTASSPAAGGGVQECEVRASLIATNVGLGVSKSRARSSKLLYNSGGGASSSTLEGCLIQGNSGLHSSLTNLNCTFSENNAAWPSCFSTNCLFAFNNGTFFGVLVHCLAYPAAYANTPSTAVSSYFPNLLGDGWHLSADSPAIARGTNLGLTSLDIDGHPWASPPAVGCDEWNPEPLLISQPRVVPSAKPGEAVLFGELAGAPPYCWWTKDGLLLENTAHYSDAHTAAMVVNGFGPSDAGNYQMIASNSFGVVTSAVVAVRVACVSGGSPDPVVPYTSWESAARTIQQAIDAAEAGTVVLVTNGVYASGERLGGETASRVVVDKPITVIAVGGPENTVIEGAWDAESTNGPGSLRCVWLGEGARLGHFTLSMGSTLGDGGGVWSASWQMNETVVGCVITNCRARGHGGGAFQGGLRECLLIDNIAGTNGGGAAFARLERTLVKRNSAVQGGGLYMGLARGCRILENVASNMGGGAAGNGGDPKLVACIVAFNQAPWYGGAVSSALFHCNVVSNTALTSAVAGAELSELRNSVVYFNRSLSTPGGRFEDVGGSSSKNNICSPYKSSLPYDIIVNSDPQLLDLSHISATSPCRGTGGDLGKIGFPDIDGDDWANPPSIGCDEFIASNLSGPLSVTISGWPTVAVGGVMPLVAQIEGRAWELRWDFGDDLTSTAGFSTGHTWTNPGAYTVSATVLNADHPEGISSAYPVQVVPVTAPQMFSPERTPSHFSAEFAGQPGLTYELHSTTNLVPPIEWQLIQTLNCTGEIMTLTDSNSLPSRFYRLKVR